MRRIARVLVLGALATGLIGAFGGAQVASGQTGPVGYTSGLEFAGDGAACSLYSVDMGTGATQQVNAPVVGECADGLTFAPDGTLYAFRNAPIDGFPPAELVTIDTTTGQQTLIGELPPIVIGSGGMTFDAAGNLWLYAAVPSIGIDDECSASEFRFCLWQVNPADASTTFVGVAPEFTAVFGLAASCAGDVLAITTIETNGPVNDTELQSVDTATGALAPVVALPDIFIPVGLDYDADDGLWALSGSATRGIGPMESDLIDPETGTVTATPLTVGGEGFLGFLSGLAISPISCSEPPPTPEPIVLQPTFTG
jgi:hypothetical protein